MSISPLYNVSSGLPKVAVHRFRSKDDLLSRYGISLEKVTVSNQSKYLGQGELDEVAQRKEEYLIKLLQAHEHALKNKKLKGSKFSDRQYASNLEFELSWGSDKRRFWVTAGNFEMNISELICGERGGMTVGINKALKILPIEWVNQLPDDANIENILKVKRLLMSSSKPIGEDKSAWQPCSDCYAWMGTNRFFSPKTQIISFLKDDKSNLVLEVRTLKDLLPVEDLKTISTTDKPLADLKIEYSDNAKKALTNSPIPETVIYEMLNAAKTEYYSGAQINKGFSGKNSASAVLFNESSEIFTARRVEWVPRWVESPDLLAAKIGINNLTQQGIESPTVKAVAYFGDHKEEPSIKSNGHLAQKRGSKDVILIVIENDVIKVRTILDYQPWIHGSVRKLSANRETV